MTDTTREAASPVPGAQPDEHEGGNLVRLNARTAKRQQLLLAGVGAVLLVGGSWASLSAFCSRETASSRLP